MAWEIFENKKRTTEIPNLAVFPDWLLKEDVLEIIFADHVSRKGKRRPQRAVVEQVMEAGASLYVTVFDFDAMTLSCRRILPGDVVSLSVKLQKSRSALEDEYALKARRERGESFGKTIRLIDNVRSGAKALVPALPLAAE